MKTKGISFWEQHVERLVLGLALIVCLLLVAIQFLGEPNAVRVGNQSVSPGEVDAKLQARAKEVSDQLDSTTAVDLGAAADTVLPRLRDRMNTPVIPAPSLAVLQASVTPGGGSEAPVGDRPFVEPKVPTPTDLSVRTFWDGIDEKVVDDNPDLKVLLASAAPYDKNWSTVGCRFDKAGLLRQFSEPGPNGEAALLSTWTQSNVFFIDVKVEREEYVDGQWTNHTLLEPMPGMFSFRKELKGAKVDDAMRNDVLTRAADRAVRQQIIQPPFYDTVNDSWVPPGETKTETIAADDPAGDLKQQRAGKQKKLDHIIAEIKASECGDSPPPPKEKTPKPAAAPPKPKGGGGAPGAQSPDSGSGGAMSNSGGRGMRNPGGGNTTVSPHCEQLWNTRHRLEEDISKLDAKIEEITGKKPDKPAETTEVKEEPETVLDIWAHDLGIVPGHTYHYRMTVEVYNPLFGHKIELIAKQQALAEQFTISSEASAWTDPITAEPPLRLFVTQARQATGGPMETMSLGSASAEVYRFHDGRWWLQSFNLQPGDRVGQPKASGSGNTSVDYGTDWFVLDVVPTLGASDQDDKNGYGASVLLQSLSDPTVTAWRSPRDDAQNPERRDLSGKVKVADLSSESTASTTTPPAPGAPKPSTTTPPKPAGGGPPKPSAPPTKPGGTGQPHGGTHSSKG